MVCPSWAAVLGGITRMDADNRRLTNPLTGEPDAGKPPVRFGGRGKVNPLSLPLSKSTIPVAAASDARRSDERSPSSRPSPPRRRGIVRRALAISRGRMRLKMGTACVPRAADGVAPSASFSQISRPLGGGHAWFKSLRRDAAKHTPEAGAPHSQRHRSGLGRACPHRASRTWFGAQGTDAPDRIGTARGT